MSNLFDSTLVRAAFEHATPSITRENWEQVKPFVVARINKAVDIPLLPEYFEGAIIGFALDLLYLELIKRLDDEIVLDNPTTENEDNDTD